MSRAALVPLLAVAALAAGCAGSPPGHSSTPSTGTHASPLVYARFEIRGTYPAGSHLARLRGRLRRDRFTLTCRSPHLSVEVGRMSWNSRLCLAVLNYLTAPRSGSTTACDCPAFVQIVDIRGQIRGRSMHEKVTPCLCGWGRRAAAAGRVILTIHPPAAQSPGVA